MARCGTDRREIDDSHVRASWLIDNSGIKSAFDHKPVDVASQQTSSPISLKRPSMSEPRSGMSTDNSNAVPLEAPPAYDAPKPDDVDIEQHTNDQREGPSTRMMAFFSRHGLYWKKFALYFAIAVVSLWFTVVILNAFGVRRSGIVYSTSYSKEHRFRPAASPIITQTLDDGRTLIRGAQPTML